jgi:hypothetical protein
MRRSSSSYLEEIYYLIEGDKIMGGYDEMLSSLGYDALDLIFGFNTKTLPEAEKKELVHLAGLLEKNEEIRGRIQSVLAENMDDVTKKNILLSMVPEKEI